MSFNIAQNGTLLSLSGNDDIITLPNTVKSIPGAPFKDLPATKLQAASGCQIENVDPGFLSGSNFRSVSLPLLQQESPSIFANQYLLESIEISEMWHTIPEYTFSACIKLTSLRINNTNILSNFTLIMQGGIRYCGVNAFADVSFVDLILPREFGDAWAFPFANHAVIKTITIHSALPYLVTEMFAGCRSLSLIVHDGETLLENGQLNLLSVSPRNYQTRDVFRGIRIDTVELSSSSNFNSYFFASILEVTTLIFHSSFPGENFTVPYEVEYFPFLTTLSIGPYDIMVDNVVDLSYTPLKSFGTGAFSNLDVFQVFFSTSVTKIPPYCFDNCFLLNKVVFPFGVDEIPVGCFRNCFSLNSLVIRGLELFEDNALVLYNSGLRRFGNESFRGVFITKITFASQMSLSNNAFADIDALNEIEFVSFQVSTDAITSAPFRNTNLSIVTVPKGSFCYDLPPLSPFFFLGTPLQLYDEWSTTNCLPSVPNSSTITGYTFHPNNTYRLVSCSLQDNSITLPDKIKYVSIGAFRECGATEIIFGSDLESLDDNAFLGSKIISVTFPVGYTSMNHGLFNSIKNVNNVTFLGNVTTIAAYAFYSSNVNRIKIQNNTILADRVLDLTGITSVGKDAFGLSDFIDLKIPSTIENHGSIGMSLQVERVEFTGFVSSIAANLFDGCTSLKSFMVNNVEHLANQILNLTTLYYLNIGSYAFRGVPIKGLIFHRGVFFHSNAFDGCPLTDFYFDAPIPTLFVVPPQLRHITSLVNLYMDSTPIIINQEVVYIASRYNYDAFADLPIVSAKVNALSVSMFDDCTKLKEVTFESTISTIPDNAFRGCTSLESLVRDGGTPHYLANNRFTTYNLIRIGTNAFFNVQFEYLFLECTRLSVGDLAFASNKALKIVELWNLGFNGLSLDSGAQIFLESPNIQIVNYTQVTYCENIELLFEEIFSGTPLENNTWKDYGCTEDYSFLTYDTTNSQRLIGCDTSRYEIILPEHIVTIANMTFSNCLSKELYFQRDSKLQTIESWAFNNSKFERVEFPASLTVIPPGLFAGQDIIEAVSFEGRLTEIPENVFNWARNLQFLEINYRPVLENRHLTLWLPAGSGAFVRNRLVNITCLVHVDMLFNMFFELSHIWLFDNSIPNDMFGSEYSLTNIYYRNYVVLSDAFLDLTPIVFVGSRAFRSVYIATIRLNQDTFILFDSFEDMGGNNLTLLITGFYNYDELRALLYLPHLDTMTLNSIPIATRTTLNLSSFFFSSIPSYEFAFTSYQSITLSNGLTQLSEGLFESCFQLTTVDIPARITSLPTRLFENCYRLTTIRLGQANLLSSGVLTLNVNEAHEAAFSSMNFNTIVFASQIFFDDNCFRNTSVTSVEFQTTQIQAQGSPFMNCTKLTSVKLPLMTQCSSLNTISFANLFKGSSIQNSKWSDFGCIELSLILPTVDTKVPETSRSTTSIPSGNNSDSGGMSSATIALIILIIVIIVIAAVVIIFLVYRQRRGKSQNFMTEDDSMQRNLLET